MRFRTLLRLHLAPRTPVFSVTSMASTECSGGVRGGPSTDCSGVVREGGPSTDCSGGVREGGLSTDCSGVVREGGLSTDCIGVVREGGLSTDCIGVVREGGLSTDCIGLHWTALGWCGRGSKHGLHWGGAGGGSKHGLHWTALDCIGVVREGVSDLSSVGQLVMVRFTQQPARCLGTMQVWEMDAATEVIGPQLTSCQYTTKAELADVQRWSQRRLSFGAESLLRSFDHQLAPPESHTCTICMCETASEDYVTVCGHHFHHACIVPWLERKECCPVCKGSLPLASLPQAWR